MLNLKHSLCTYTFAYKYTIIVTFFDSVTLETTTFVENTTKITTSPISCQYFENDFYIKFMLLRTLNLTSNVH